MNSAPSFWPYGDTVTQRSHPKNQFRSPSFKGLVTGTVVSALFAAMPNRLQASEVEHPVTITAAASPIAEKPTVSTPDTLSSTPAASEKPKFLRTFMMDRHAYKLFQNPDGVYSFRVINDPIPDTSHSEIIAGTFQRTPAGAKETVIVTIPNEDANLSIAQFSVSQQATEHGTLRRMNVQVDTAVTDGFKDTNAIGRQALLQTAETLEGIIAPQKTKGRGFWRSFGHGLHHVFNVPIRIIEAPVEIAIKPFVISGRAIQNAKNRNKPDPAPLPTVSHDAQTKIVIAQLPQATVDDVIRAARFGMPKTVAADASVAVVEASNSASPQVETASLEAPAAPTGMGLLGLQVEQPLDFRTSSESFFAPRQYFPFAEGNEQLAYNMPSRAERQFIPVSAVWQKSTDTKQRARRTEPKPVLIAANESTPVAAPVAQPTRVVVQLPAEDFANTANTQQDQFTSPNRMLSTKSTLLGSASLIGLAAALPLALPLLGRRKKDEVVSSQPSSLPPPDDLISAAVHENTNLKKAYHWVRQHGLGIYQNRWALGTSMAVSAGTRLAIVGAAKTVVAKFAFAAMATTIPGFAATVASPLVATLALGVASGAVAGGINNVIRTRRAMHGKAMDKGAICTAFWQGAKTGAVWGAVGGTVGNFIGSHIGHLFGGHHVATLHDTHAAVASASHVTVPQDVAPIANAHAVVDTASQHVADHAASLSGSDLRGLLTAEQFHTLPLDVQHLAQSGNAKDWVHFCQMMSAEAAKHPHGAFGTEAQWMDRGISIADANHVHGTIAEQLHGSRAYDETWARHGYTQNDAAALADAKLSGNVMDHLGERLTQELTARASHPTLNL